MLGVLVVERHNLLSSKELLDVGKLFNPGVDVLEDGEFFEESAHPEVVVDVESLVEVEIDPGEFVTGKVLLSFDVFGELFDAIQRVFLNLLSIVEHVHLLGGKTEAQRVEHTVEHVSLGSDFGSRAQEFWRILLSDVAVDCHILSDDEVAY